MSWANGGMHDSHETGRRPGRRPMLAGVEVREEDLEQPAGLHAAAVVVRVSAVVVFILALAQFAAWWIDRPPGGAGLGLLVGDTIRLTVVSALLWAASQLIELLVKSHYDIRAGRILLARQTYMLRQMGLASGHLPEEEVTHDRRADDPAAHGTS
ncbi:MAG TPA: hypothetical protein VFJ16_16150 [Longimicrobium sp.]|nr:hypothetical protein [Longimicrobium sp.]